jgi:hypothetical protein
MLMTNTIVSSIADPYRVSKPSNDNLHIAIRSILNYRPPQDYAEPDDDSDRLAFECPLGYTPYVRDLAFEGCFIDMEQGRE